MSASSRNFAAARQAAFGTPENAGNEPLGNMQFQIGPNGELRIVPVQTTTSSEETIPPTEVQDPESIAREEEEARIAMERLDSFIKMKRAKKIVNTGPPNPSMVNVSGLNYYTSVPPSNPKYAWVGNRDTNFDRWHRIGDPIREEDVGPTTFRAIQQSSLNNKDKFSPEHHGFNVSAEAAMSDDALKGRLSSWGLPTEGDRNTLFERVVRGNTLSDVDLRTKLGILEKNAPEATSLTEQEKNYLMGNNPYQEAADVFRRERAEGIRNREAFLARRTQQPQTNPSSITQPTVQQNTLGAYEGPITGMGAYEGSIANYGNYGAYEGLTIPQPPNVVQPPAPQEPQGPLYGGTMRLGDEAPMSTSIIGGSSSQTQNLTQSPSLYSRITPQANTGAVVAEEAGAMGGAEMMASRAIPMLNMVFIGKMLADSLTADSKEKKMQQEALMYRT